MSTLLRQRTTPLKISTSLDTHQQPPQRQHSFSSTTTATTPTKSLNSPSSYREHRSTSTMSNSYPNGPFNTNKSNNNYTKSSNVSFRSTTNATTKYPPIAYSSPTNNIRSNSNNISIDIGSDKIYNIDHDQNNGWKQRVLLVIGLVCLFAPWMRHSRVQWQVQQLKDELIELQNDQIRLQSRLRTQNDAYTTITNDITKYQNKNQDLLQQLRDHGDHYHDFDAQHYTEHIQLEDAYMKRIESLEKEVQRTSDRQLVARGYGTAFRRSDAIRVEIILNHDVSTFGNKLIMELGPMNFLSHAIELFLMLVEHKHYYDHLMLMHRTVGSSIISTVPMDSDTLQIVSNNIIRDSHTVISSSNNDKQTPIVSSRENTFMMNQLALLEHTEDYPVQKYSVLFADKGPHFYIQMEDPTKQSNNNQAANNMKKQETCFGKIVEGQGILDYMVQHSDKKFRGWSMVGIETIKVMKPESANDAATNKVGTDPRFPIS
jgi:hypothetical protein